MIIEVKVIPQARRTRVLRECDPWKVYLCAPAVDGKANKALIECLARHFGVKKSRIEITKGLKSRHKTITIRDY